MMSKDTVQWLEINFRDDHPVSFSFFQELEDRYEKIKAKVQEKEVISKEDIKELLIKPSMEYSHYTSFVHKFVTNMEKLKSAILPSM
jgi:menaquinone-dependent protoporphyrinogen IX oxidase